VELLLSRDVSSCMKFDFMSSINPYSLTKKLYQEQEQKHAVQRAILRAKDHINAQSTMYHRSVSCPGAGIQLSTIFIAFDLCATP